jgi:hypothetical protein
VRTLLLVLGILLNVAVAAWCARDAYKRGHKRAAWGIVLLALTPTMLALALWIYVRNDRAFGRTSQAA